MHVIASALQDVKSQAAEGGSQEVATAPSARAAPCESQSDATIDSLSAIRAFKLLTFGKKTSKHPSPTTLCHAHHLGICSIYSPQQTADERACRLLRHLTASPQSSALLEHLRSATRDADNETTPMAVLGLHHDESAARFPRTRLCHAMAARKMKRTAKHLT